jgi:hypothetical protein
MLFITGEKKKQNEIAAHFHALYDGTPKEYPNGTMMIFISLNEGTNYSPEEHTHYIFKHESFLGDEATLCIGGLQDIGINILFQSLVQCS